MALQYEFTKLHLDDVLERLKNHESEELAVQISAYVDNEFDIAVLMEEAEEKAAAMERVADLEDEVGRLNETMQELEVNAMATQVQFENQIEELRGERDKLLQNQQKVESENSTLRRDLSSREQDSKKRQSTLEERIRELETNIKLVQQNGSVGSQSSLGSSSVGSATGAPAPPPPAPAPPPPPPPPPPPMMAPPPPPPPPGGKLPGKLDF